MDWNQPYSCTEWAETFGITYPIIDDESNFIYNLFGIGYIPHNVIIDHTMTVRYSAAGYNQSAIVAKIEQYLAVLPSSDSDEDGIANADDNCPSAWNPDQTDTDGDLSGNVCDFDDDGDGCTDESDTDPLVFGADDDGDGISNHCDACDNLNVYASGNATGDVSGGQPVIDVLDIVLVVQRILGQASLSECQAEAADANNDGSYSVLDVVALVNTILNQSGGQGAASSEGRAEVWVVEEPDGIRLEIGSEIPIGGLEFTLDGPEVPRDALRLNGENAHLQVAMAPIQGGTKVLLYDLTGLGISMPVKVSVSGSPTREVNNLVIASRIASEVPATVARYRVDDSVSIPGRPVLSENFPNPFNPATRIPFSLPYDCRVTLEVFNHLGQNVAQLVRGEMLGAGRHEAVWSAADLPAGVYFIRLTTDEGSQVRKAVLLK